MATCPYCGGYLGEGHLCRGLGVRLWWWTWSLAVSLAVGGLIGSTIFRMLGAMVDAPALDAAGWVVGPIALFMLIRSVRQW